MDRRRPLRPPKETPLHPREGRDARVEARRRHAMSDEEAVEAWARSAVETARRHLGPALLAQLGESPEAVRGARVALLAVVQLLMGTEEYCGDDAETAMGAATTALLG